jgi:hypothetical protein
LRRLESVAPPEQETALAAFNERQYDPKSPDYHRWLHSEEFGQLYGPSDADITQITSWLENQGFQINGVGKGKVFIDFSGTVAQVQDAFHLEMHRYLVKGKENIANDRDPQIPTALAPVITGIASLNDFFPKHLSHFGGYVKRDLKTGKYTPVEPAPTPVDGLKTQASGLKGNPSGPMGIQPEFGYTDAETGYLREMLSPTPQFSPAAGTYGTAQAVNIYDITPNATIYYTTNGTTPTTSSTKYTGTISVAATETIKAIATGYTNSAVATAFYTIGYPIETFVATSSGTNVLTIPVGGSTAFTVASENQSGQSYPSVTVKTSTGANPSLPVQVTLCQTNPSTGQCMATPWPTITLAPFAAGTTPSFSVFVTATATIASSPSNEILVLFTNASGTVLSSASVLVVNN